MELTERDQDKVFRKALKIMGLKNDRMFFIAVITETLHPEDSVEVEHKGYRYYVTIKNGDFVCIYLK